MKAIRTFLVVFALCAFATFAPALLAQDAAPTPDLANVTLPGGIPAVSILALLGTIIVSGVKLVIPKIPGKYLPFIAPVITVLLDWLSGLTFGTSSNVWVALGAGVASIGLFELKKQATAKPLV